MTDWIEHNGGPQPVADDVWVEIDEGHIDHDCGAAREFDWNREEWFRWNVINQHLIDAKQAEIDALRDDLETWQSVFPHVMPDRLKSDQQLAEEDVAAKIDAARHEGIRLGLEAAKRHTEAIAALQSGRLVAIPSLYPDTIAKEAQHD